jgi:hypothetical protein
MVPDKNPLDKLELLRQERKTKRKTLLATLLDSLDPVLETTRKWFNYETQAIDEEIDLLGTIMPEEMPTWKTELDRTKTKFKSALQYIREVAKKAKRGELESVEKVYKRPSRDQLIEIPPLPRARKKEKGPLDIAESLLELWDAASELEKLANKVENEAVRTLRLRRLVRLEVKEQRSQKT